MIRWRLKLMIGLLGLAASLATAGSASASMLISQSETFAFSAHSSADNGMSSRAPVEEKQQPVQPDQLQKQLAVPIDSSGMSSSPSSVAGGTSASQALPSSLLVFQQDPLTSRLASEAKLVLPAPLVLGLIRPPQILS